MIHTYMYARGQDLHTGQYSAITVEIVGKLSISEFKAF